MLMHAESCHNCHYLQITIFDFCRKCINKYNTAAILPTIRIPKSPNLNQEYCNIDKSESNDIQCDPHYKYRLMNGRCNNLAFANWGSSFHCHRRLLPPDYSDGINQPRVAVDGQTLPSPRTITSFLMPDIMVPDPNLSGLNMAWGQFMVHDAFRTIQNLGLAINCCLIPNATVHPECVPIVNFPQDEATGAFNNQQCINTVRSIACNTCSLGMFWFIASMSVVILLFFKIRTTRPTERCHPSYRLVQFVWRQSDWWFAYFEKFQSRYVNY